MTKSGNQPNQTKDERKQKVSVVEISKKALNSLIIKNSC
jgi:hypothetical protein